MNAPRTIAVAACLSAAAPAFASLAIPDRSANFRGTITADNHYALYSSIAGDFTYHGGNETGHAGSLGAYNWSHAESYEFEAGDYLYIAAWSDDRVAQGVLAEFHSDSLGAILSGDPRWQVFASGVDRGTGDSHPDASEIASHAAFADANNLWESTVTGGSNGVAPWSTIAGIDAHAAWMWRSAGETDAFRGSHGLGEMLVFRTAVPAPGAIALLGLGGLLTVRRRR
jgi:hypothetical protein